MLPVQILFLWLRGLLAVAMIVLSIYLVREWYERAHDPVETTHVEPAEGGHDAGATTTTTTTTGQREFDPDFGFNAETALLAGGLALLLVSLAGAQIARPFLGKARPGDEDPTHTRDPAAATQRVRRPDGSELHVEQHGPAGATPIVLVHGWGADSAEWFYVRRELGSRFRLIAWDLPGLGLSKGPDNRDHSVEKMARDLDAVLALAGDRPAVLLGHSIGGMILLEFARLFPEALGRRVSKLVLVHTTYTNPLKTMNKAGLYTAIQKPVIEPLAHLMIWLWPVVKVLNWLAYLNGSAHLSMRRSGFAGTQSYGQLDFAARYYAKANPAVFARGALGMLHWDAGDVPKAVRVPALVVGGDQDPTCRPEASQKIAGDAPSGELEMLSPARHMGLLEHHARFDATVGVFVADNEPAATTEKAAHVGAGSVPVS